MVIPFQSGSPTICNVRPDISRVEETASSERADGDNAEDEKNEDREDGESEFNPENPVHVDRVLSKKNDRPNTKRSGNILKVRKGAD